jgi:hypothetical protein
MTTEPRILFYDIETCLMPMYAFRLGKQVVRHTQLMKGYFYRPHIITISYMFEGDSSPSVLTWGESEADEKKMVQEFTKIVKSADLTIGKNNMRFDNKHINTQRLIYNLEGYPDWNLGSDDLESQIRRNFYAPSFSLDYFSELLGYGGKDSMCFGDWVELIEYRMLQLGGVESKGLLELLTGKKLSEVKRDGKKAIKKMAKYNKKDVTDTKNLWDYCSKHFRPKLNRAAFSGEMVCCNCGSADVRKDGTKVSGGVKYQRWYCRTHNGYAGRSSLNAKTIKMRG